MRAAVDVGRAPAGSMASSPDAGEAAEGAHAEGWGVAMIDEQNKALLRAAMLAAFTAIVTAGANAIAEELKARWRRQEPSASAVRDDQEDK